MNFFENVLENISESLGAYVPNTIIAILILIIGLFIAKFIKSLLTKLIHKTGIDDRLGESKIVLSKLIGKVIYFILMSIVFMVSLEKLGMTTALEPLRTMTNKFLQYIPNVIVAGLVGYIGYMLANVVSELVGLSGNTIQKFAPKLRLPENINLVDILKKIVFIFIFKNLYLIY